jgi:hypothetical protein
LPGIERQARVYFDENLAGAALGFLQWSSWPGYLDMRRLNTSFEALAGYEDF